MARSRSSRVERLYPLPAKDLAKQLRRFDHVEEVRWVQDEPANQGAWPFMALQPAAAPGRSRARPELAADQGDPRRNPSAPSVGSASVHLQQQRALMEAAFA